MKEIYDKSVEELSEFYYENKPVISAGVEVSVVQKGNNSFVKVRGDNVGGQNYDIDITGLKETKHHYLKHHTLALIDAEIERKKDEVDESIKEDGDEGWSNFVGSWEDFLEEVGRQKQIRNDLTYLKEQRELIDNS